MSDLSDLIARAARQAIADGITTDDIGSGPDDRLTAWIRDNVAYRPDSEFYVHFLIGGEIADEYARRYGFESQADRAAKIAFGKFRNAQTVPGLPPQWERV